MLFDAVRQNNLDQVRSIIQAGIVEQASRLGTNTCQVLPQVVVEYTGDMFALPVLQPKQFVEQTTDGLLFRLKRLGHGIETANQRVQLLFLLTR